MAEFAKMYKNVAVEYKKHMFTCGFFPEFNWD